MLVWTLVLSCALINLSVSTDSAEWKTHPVQKRQSAFLPTRPCLKSNERETYYPPNSNDLMWICRSGMWTPYQLTPSIGTTEKLPARSCKEIRDVKANECNCALKDGTYWINKTDPCMKRPPKIIKVYCDMTLNGGGWSLVWKHSAMQVARPLTQDMKYFSDFYKPCTDLEAGWCNIPDKGCFNPTEMMIAAYHNKKVVYAYKATFNRNLDSDWTGGIINSFRRIVDYCRHNIGVKPDPSVDRAGSDLTMLGINFDKHSPNNFYHNCDVYRGTLSNPTDCRWENCCGSGGCPVHGTVRQHTQMTVVIFVR